MERPDLNLLYTLEVLLAEGSVARAAQRLRLSASAMSRALARLRDATGDPLLVRAGRRLVPTPRALALRAPVSRLVQEAVAVLRPTDRLDLAGLVRTFTLRTSDGFVETYGPSLMARVAADSPGVRLRFVQKTDRDSTPLRDGSVDLETGVVRDDTSPELRTCVLFEDRFVAVVRAGHPLTKGRITAERYAAASHVGASRRAAAQGPIDDALRALGLTRQVDVSVGGFATALALARTTDLVATVPENHTRNLRENLRTLTLPFAVPGVTVSLLWHPRLDADAAHRWLRDLVRNVCRQTKPRSRAAP